jgi:hypothetical protein
MTSSTSTATRPGAAGPDRARRRQPQDLPQPPARPWAAGHRRGAAVWSGSTTGSAGAARLSTARQRRWRPGARPTQLTLPIPGLSWMHRTSSRSTLSSQVGSPLAVAGRRIQKVNRLSGRKWPPTRQNDRLQRRHRWIQAYPHDAPQCVSRPRALVVRVLAGAAAVLPGLPWLNAGASARAARAWPS